MCGVPGPHRCSSATARSRPLTHPVCSCQMVALRPTRPPTVHERTGRGTLSRTHSRRGYAGYEYDPGLWYASSLISGTVPPRAMWHVRNRVLDSETGRWTRRDPLGYVDGMGLYEYVRSRPTYQRDWSGLLCAGTSWPYEPTPPISIYAPEVIRLNGCYLRPSRGYSSCYYPVSCDSREARQAACRAFARCAYGLPPGEVYTGQFAVCLNSGYNAFFQSCSQGAEEGAANYHYHRRIAECSGPTMFADEWSCLACRTTAWAVLQLGCGGAGRFLGGPIVALLCTFLHSTVVPSFLPNVLPAGLCKAIGMCP